MNYVKEFLAFLLEFLKEKGINPIDVLAEFFKRKFLHPSAQAETVDLLREYGFDVQHPAVFPEGKVILGSKDVVEPSLLHPTTEIAEGAKPKDTEGNVLPGPEPAKAEPAKPEESKPTPTPHN